MPDVRDANLRRLYQSGVQSRAHGRAADGNSGRGERGRVYLSPTRGRRPHAHNAKPEWKPDVTISGSTQYLGVKPYGMERFDQLFTNRQLVALTTFFDLVQEVRGASNAMQWPRAWRMMVSLSVMGAARKHIRRL